MDREEQMIDQAFVITPDTAAAAIIDRGIAKVYDLLVTEHNELPHKVAEWISLAMQTLAATKTPRPPEEAAATKNDVAWSYYSNDQKNKRDGRVITVMHSDCTYSEYNRTNYLDPYKGLEKPGSKTSKPDAFQGKETLSADARFKNDKIDEMLENATNNAQQVVYGGVWYVLKHFETEEKPMSHGFKEARKLFRTLADKYKTLSAAKWNEQVLTDRVAATQQLYGSRSESDGGYEGRTKITAEEEQALTDA